MEPMVFDCHYYFKRDAHAQLLLNLVDAKSSALLYSQSQRTEAGVGAGIFGDVNHPAEYMQKDVESDADSTECF
jgi:hypothetical protein